MASNFHSDSIHQTQLEDLVVKREEALHAQRHYLAELEKDTKKRANFQSVTDTVQIEFQVSQLD